MPSVPAKPAAAPPRGRLVDIGGRSLRVVETGEAGATPLIVFEAGAFGCSSDFAVVQDRTAGRWRSLAYDRAGLGMSDPGPEPRDSTAITDDLATLLDVLDETRPVLLVGHSMAAVHVQTFAMRWPGRVAGLVLLDAIPAEALSRPRAQNLVRGAQRVALLARTGAALKVSALSAPLFGDAVGLSGQARQEKLRAFASPTHNYWGGREISLWLDDAEQAMALGELDRELPVAVVTAGKAPAEWRRLQEEPARRSRSGYVERAPDAGHASLLGPKHNAVVVRAIEFVMRAALALPVRPG